MQEPIGNGMDGSIVVHLMGWSWPYNQTSTDQVGTVEWLVDDDRFVGTFWNALHWHCRSVFGNLFWHALSLLGRCGVGCLELSWFHGLRGTACFIIYNVVLMWDPPGMHWFLGVLEF